MSFECNYREIESKLYSAVISDILDSLGYRRQTMDPAIRPLRDEMVLFGRAKTVMAADVNRMPDKPYAKLIDVLDAIGPGEIFVAALGGSTRSAFWGELLSTATRARGGRGAVIDGLSRDSRKIIEMQFPLFSRGMRPTDSLGRNEVIECDTPIECGGVTVQPGDFIFGDIDGIVVIPAAVAAEVIERALQKVSAENQVRDAIRNEGMKVADAYAKFGVL
ncbi:MAG: RraA family protein [Sporomusaceae bacterium]|nr:RraA family protein [Sporomusaceae bacterium]